VLWRYFANYDGFSEGQQYRRKVSDTFDSTRSLICAEPAESRNWVGAPSSLNTRLADKSLTPSPRPVPAEIIFIQRELLELAVVSPVSVEPSSQLSFTMLEQEGGNVRVEEKHDEF
jgi:hypothetical protein